MGRPQGRNCSSRFGPDVARRRGPVDGESGPQSGRTQGSHRHGRFHLRSQSERHRLQGRPSPGGRRAGRSQRQRPARAVSPQRLGHHQIHRRSPRHHHRPAEGRSPPGSGRPAHHSISHFPGGTTAGRAILAIQKPPHHHPQKGFFFLNYFNGPD